MALNEMEFLGNDRYFKYRYARKTEINYSTPLESWVSNSKLAQYKIMQDYLKRTLNMNVNFAEHKFGIPSVSWLYANTSEPYLVNKSHILTLDMPRSYFYERLEYFTPSPPYGTEKMIIVSVPKKIVSVSLSFLNMTTEVLSLMVSTVVVLSLLLVIHSIVTNKYKSLPTKKVFKKLAHEILENIWENASLLCAEPIPDVLTHITCRLLASSWIIGVTFILFFLGCFLRTEFTTESYNCIDTLSDLIKSGITPSVTEGRNFHYLQYLAAHHPDVKKWVDTLKVENVFNHPSLYSKVTGYIPILSGERVLIATEKQINSYLGYIMAYKPEVKDFLVSQGGLYFSQQDLSFDYLHTMFNTSWMRSSPQVHENAQLSMAPILETQVFNYLDFEYHYFVEQIMWKKPLKSTVDLDLRSVSVPFYLLFTLMSFTVPVVIAEIIFN